MNDTVFLFTFGNGDYNFDKDKECRYTVYSYNDKDIWKFIHQHGCFDLNTIRIDIINDYSDGDIFYNGEYLTEDNKLTSYKFKSNNNKNEVYELLSTNEIVCHILTLTVDELLLPLELGKSLMHYKNIEFINTMISLLCDLPHIYIELNTDDNGNDIPATDIDSIIQSFNDFELSHTISSVSYKNHIMEMTIESYASGFTDIMINKYQV